jgi:polar amino acid transport system substrate-binding protein
MKYIKHLFFYFKIGRKISMKLKKILIGASVLTASLLLVTGCGGSKEKSTDSLQKIKDKGTLVVATSADYPPLEFQILENGENKIIGLDIDLAQAIADDLKVELKIKNMEFDSVLTAVASGKADVAIAGLDLNDKRKKSYDFSTSYYQSGVVALVQKKDAQKYNKISDFDDKQVLAQQGSTVLEVVKKQISTAKILTVGSVPSGVMQLQAEKVAALALDKTVAVGYAKNNSDLAIAKFEFRDTATQKAVLMKKKSAALKKVIDKVINEQISSGKIEESLKKNGALQDKARE